MEKINFSEDMQLMAVKPGRQKRQKVIVLQQKSGGMYSYGPDGLKDALQALRDFVAFDMAAEMKEDTDISAWRLSSELMPLDYLIREVEFKEVEVLV